MRSSWGIPMKRIVFFQFIILLALGSAQASDFQSGRTAALGGAGHASPLLSDSVYLNPSFASFSKTYSFSGTYAFYHGGDVQPDGSNYIHGKILNVGVQDGRNEFFQAGAGGTLRESGKLLNLGASKAILPNLSVGIGGKFFFANPNSGHSSRDANLSVTYVVNPWLQFSAIGDNLFNTTADREQNFGQEFILGSKYNLLQTLIIYIDPHIAPWIPNQPSFGWEAGAEFALFKDFFLRGGAFRNSAIMALSGQRGHGIGYGVGWIAPRISFDYGLQRAVEPSPTTSHVFSMTVYM